MAQSGLSGEASLAEVGEIELSANEATDFGHTSLTLRADNVYDARLVVMWDDGAMECELPASPAVIH